METNLDYIQKSAIVVSLIDSLKENGSWCGETHIQKTTFFLQELFGIPLDFDFILYKHGPFSFDLRSLLSFMFADVFLAYEPFPGYGPKIKTIEGSDFLRKNYSVTINKYSSKIKSVAKIFGDKNVAELEKIATAYYVKKNMKIEESKFAEKINEMKPHISIEDAKKALSATDEIIKSIQSEM